MKKVLVVGADGQLGNCIKDLVNEVEGIRFDFKEYQDLDITDSGKVLQVFSEGDYDFCINCAAYTAVDKAEEESEKAFEVNAEATKYLAEASREYGVVLIHISTDFIFDGSKKFRYNETDEPNPLNVYGDSKLKGEQYVQDILDKYFIIRTSWVYSEHGNNFVKTMLRLSESRDTLQVINDQIGSPTYARDLGAFILQLISESKEEYGIYNFSNDAEISWCDFAKEIFEVFGISKEMNLIPISTEQYPSGTRRPKFSALSNQKRKDLLGNEFTSWKDSLKDCMSRVAFKS